MPIPFALYGLYVVLGSAARVAAPIIVRQIFIQGVKVTAKQAPKQIAKQAAGQGTKAGLKQTAKQAPAKVKPSLKVEPKPKACAPCEALKSKAKAKAKNKPNSTASDKKYSRKGVRRRKGFDDEVWNNSKSPDGKVRDPKTKKVMKRSDPWDRAHKPGYEFKKHVESAKRRDISRKEFLDEYQNPKHYRAETINTNRSRKLESKSGKKWKGEKKK